MKSRITGLYIPFIIGILCIGVALMIQKDVVRPAPFHFTQAQYAPRDGVVCPGDSLVYTSESVIERVPSVVTMVVSWWSVDKVRTALAYPRGEAKAYIWTHPFRVTNITSRTVPLLPSGHYELRVAGQEERSVAAVFVVPFVIAPGCEGNR